MNNGDTLPFSRLPARPPRLALTLLLSSVAFAPMALADDDGGLRPGNLLVSRSVYDVDPAIVPGVTQLPPNCVAPNCVTATASAPIRRCSTTTRPTRASASPPGSSSTS
jgi:hypothetical protein